MGQFSCRHHTLTHCTGNTGCWLTRGSVHDKLTGPHENDAQKEVLFIHTFKSVEFKVLCLVLTAKKQPYLLKIWDDWRWTYWRLWTKMRKCALLNISSLLQQWMWLFLLLVWLKPPSPAKCINTNENHGIKLKTGVNKQLPRLRRESKETLQQIHYVKLVICVKLMDLSIWQLQVRMVI